VGDGLEQRGEVVAREVGVHHRHVDLPGPIATANFFDGGAQWMQ
jgi:hypothetical protein